MIGGEGVTWDGVSSWLAQAGDDIISGVFLGRLKCFFASSTGPSVNG